MADEKKNRYLNIFSVKKLHFWLLIFFIDGELIVSLKSLHIFLRYLKLNSQIFTKIK